MTDTFEERLRGILATFDSIHLDSEYKKRVAVKPLSDYFQIAVLEVAVHLCGLDRNVLRNYHLKTRWRTIKSCLRLIEDTRKWDQLVDELQNMRSTVEHNDYRTPSKDALLRVRRRAQEFKDWLLRVGKQYHKESKGFSFIQKFLLVSDWYIRRAEWVLHLYGKKPPYSVRTDVLLPGEENPYMMLESLKNNLESRIREIDDIKGLEKEDLDNLVEIVKEIERLDARENVFLQFNTCPKCGGKIVDSEREIGGSPEDPMPSAILYTVGCENCDYEVHSETIEI